MPTFFGVHPESVREAPVLDLLKRGLLRFAEQNPILPKLRIVNVAFFRSDIEVTAQQHRRVWIVILIEQLAQAIHPFELELILVCADHLTVWHVDIDDADAGDFSSTQSRVTLRIVSGETTRDACAAGP